MVTRSATEAEPLRVSERLTIPRAELMTRASRASGPGGQHVNKSSTRIEVLWNVVGSAVLSDAEKARLQEKLGRRIDSEGWLRITASESRSQLQNRREAEERLVVTVRGALHVPRKRRPTAPTRASKEERLRSKRLQSRRKQERRADGDE
jgi:ribosome-associated protein